MNRKYGMWAGSFAIIVFFAALTRGENFEGTSIGLFLPSFRVMSAGTPYPRPRRETRFSVRRAPLSGKRGGQATLRPVMASRKPSSSPSSFAMRSRSRPISAWT